MRDRIKSTEYFEKCISQNKEYISIITEGIKNNAANQKIIDTAYPLLYVNYKDYLIASYSNGELLKEIENKYIYFIGVAEKCFDDNNSYVDCCWLVAIGVMFELKDKELDVLKNIVRKYERNDKLINYMMHYLDSSWEITGNYFMKDPYKLLDDVINTDKQNAVNLLKDYLENKWYKAHNEMAWYDSHKSKNDTYCGYWAFETGAIAKILNLDDSELKDVPYYPYDLVHCED